MDAIVKPQAKEQALPGGNATHYNPGVSEASLYTKYNNPAAALSAEPLVYEFTNDPALLHQYYLMRRDMLNKAWGVDYVHTLEDDFDRISHTMIVRKGKLVIGGYRMIVREAGEQLRLPMEIKDFDLRAALPQLGLQDRTHAEISRFAILPDYRKGDVITQMIEKMMLKGIRLGLSYAFCFSQLHRSRLWCKFVNNAGMWNANISENIFPPVPDVCGDMKYYLTVFDRGLHPGDRPLVRQSEQVLEESGADSPS